MGLCGVGLQFEQALEDWDYECEAFAAACLGLHC